MAFTEQKAQKQPTKISTRLFLSVGLFFLAAGLFAVFMLNHQMKQRALTEAESKARILLDRNLATHTYFTHNLKPALFGLTDSIRDDAYFEPVWMSSTYAVRKIEQYFKSLNPAGYYYKECAINARSPENEADQREKAFLEELNADPELMKRSNIQTMNGEPHFVVLQRGEVMEETCLRCHSTPREAPGGLVDRYGPHRSFGRKEGDVISAVSIRVPLTEAYREANQLSVRLSAYFLALLVSLFGVLYWRSNRLIFRPLSAIREKALLISSHEEHLGEKIPLPEGSELKELAMAFNAMSGDLRLRLDQLGAQGETLAVTNAQLRRRMEERDLAEQETRTSRKTLQKVFDGISDPILMLNGDMSIVMLNRAARSYYRIDHLDEVMGRACYEVTHGRSVLCDGCRVPEHLSKSDRESFSFERRGLFDPALLEQVVVYPVREGMEEETATILRITDITEKREVDRQLIRADRLSSLGQLSGGIAHEIRSPLSGIRLFVDVLTDEEKFERTEHELEIFHDIAHNVKRIDDIIKRVLAFARDTKIETREMDINHLIHETLNLWYVTLKNGEIRLELSLKEGISKVFGDAVGIQQVVNNLVQNAVQAMDGGGLLRITTGNETSSFHEGRNIVTIRVRDTGPGIAPEDRERIFNPFFTTKPQGTGLGLSISHQIIERQGGLLTFESHPGHETTFTVELPAMPGD